MKMWPGSCCVFVTLLLVIIGVAVDVLMVETGESGSFLDFQITVDYGWEEMTWSTNYDSSGTIKYSTAYSDDCNSTSSSDSYCSALKDLRDGGRVYIAFNVIGMVILSAALGLYILAALGKCMCNCKCHPRWIVAILCMSAVVCFLIAFGVFVSNFSNNVNTVFDRMFPTYILTWEAAYIGGSVACLITASVIGLASISCVLWRDRRGQVYAPLYDPTGPVYVAYAQPPPMYAPYGQPPPTYVPYGEPGPNQVLPGYTVPPGTYYSQNPNITPV